MAKQVTNRILFGFIPDIVQFAFLVITVVAIIVTLIWQIGAKCREKQVGQKVTTPENKGLLQSRQVGY